MLTSLKIAKGSTSAISFPTKRRLASQVGCIFADPYSPARPPRDADTKRDWPREVCRPPYFLSPNPRRLVGVTRGRPGGYGWPKIRRLRDQGGGSRQVSKSGDPC